MKLIHPLLILRILSIILLIESITFLLPLPVAFLNDESYSPFLLSTVIALLLSTIFSMLSRNADLKKFSNRDGYLIVSLTWFVFLAFGALPYVIGGTLPSFIDAFFESSSGFTTTGSSVIQDVEILPRSILFWRSLTHWIGGLGIIVLVVIILPTLKITGYQLFSLESSLKEKIHPKTQAIGLRIMFIYLGLTVVQVLLLLAGEMDIFDSVCFTFGTVATGGFATKNTSLMHYSAYSQYVILIFMFLAGISQVVYYYLIKFRFRRVFNDEELLFYTATVVIAGALLTSILLVNYNLNLESAVRTGFFQVISILTTTGFASADFLYWPPAAHVLIFLLLFTGASTGSTTGSIKMARHLIVIKNIKSVFTKLSHPNALNVIKLNGKLIPEKTNITILSFIILYLFIFLIGTIVVVFAGSDIASAATAVASSLGNIGPGLGTIGPMQNYSHLSDFTKFFLSILMIVGRVEVITIFTLFTRSFWKL